MDTPVWSVALRRKPKTLNPLEKKTRFELANLITANRTAIVGLIRQEVLSGVLDERSFLRLRDHLRAFDDEPVVSEDHEEAAWSRNRCAARGIAGSPVDFVLCALAIRRRWTIFTLDRDFEKYARVLPIQLHALPSRRDETKRGRPRRPAP